MGGDAPRTVPLPRCRPRCECLLATSVTSDNPGHRAGKDNPPRWWSRQETHPIGENAPCAWDTSHLKCAQVPACTARKNRK